MKHGHRGFYLEQRFLIYFSVHAVTKKNSLSTSHSLFQHINI